MKSTGADLVVGLPNAGRLLPSWLIVEPPVGWGWTGCDEPSPGVTLDIDI